MDVVRTAIEQIGGRVSLESKSGSVPRFGSTCRRPSRCPGSWWWRQAGSRLALPWTRCPRRSAFKPRPGEHDQEQRWISFFATEHRADHFVGRTDELARAQEGCRPIDGFWSSWRLQAGVPPSRSTRSATGSMWCSSRCRGLLAGARGYAGTTLLGNGQVLLVLDVKEILRLTVRRSDDGTVILDGVCAVEDAEPLLQMLQATPAAVVDWTQCRQLHTAVLQVILASRGRSGSAPAATSG